MAEKYSNMPDMCQKCTGEDHLKIYYPHSVTPKRGGVEGSYRCKRGHTWTCWWSKDKLS